MADEFRLRKQAERGVRARTILDDELTVEAFASIEKQLFTEWCETSPDETDKRERLYALYLGHLDYKQLLQQTLNEGNAAIAQLEHMKDPRRVNRV